MDEGVHRVEQNKKTAAMDTWHTPFAENTNPVEMQKNGWQAILNNFKNYT
jgi:hypothetical protein